MVARRVGMTALILCACGGSGALPGPDADPVGARPYELLPHPSTFKTTGGCDLWPAGPIATLHRTIDRVGGDLMVLGSWIQREDGFALYDDETGWSYPAQPPAVMEAFATTAGLFVQTPAGIFLWTAPGEWTQEYEASSYTALISGRDDEIYMALGRGPSVVRRRTAPGTWEDVFSTDQIIDLAIGDGEIFVSNGDGVYGWNGVELARIVVPQDTAGNELAVYGMTDDDAGNVYLYGRYGDRGVIMRRDGAAWTVLTDAPTDADPSDWSIKPYVDAAGGVLTLGDDYVYRDGTWEDVPDGRWLLGAIGDGDVYAVADVADSLEGDASDVVRLTATGWDDVPVARGIRPTDVGGVAPDDALVIEEGKLLRLIGDAWFDIPLFDGFTPITVTAEPIVQVVGWDEPGGTHAVARLVDDTWTLEPLGTALLRETGDIAARGADDVYLAADCSVFHRDAIGWTRIHGEPCPDAWDERRRPVVALLEGGGVAWMHQAGDENVVELWDGVSWREVTRGAQLTLGPLRDDDGTRRAAMVKLIQNFQPRELYLFDADATVTVIGDFWADGQSLGGRNFDDIILAGAGLYHWDGTALGMMYVSTHAAAMWTDGTTVIQTGGHQSPSQVQRCVVTWEPLP